MTDTTLPTTTIDLAFSAPGATPVSWETTERILRDAQVSWLSTVRSDGRPHVTPLVAVWTDRALHFHTGTGEQKYANLRRNPQVAVTTGCDSWRDGVDVVVEGTATEVTDQRGLGTIAAAFADRWDGRWRLAPRDGRLADPTGRTSVAFTVHPWRVRAFAKGPVFGQTTHVFAPTPAPQSGAADPEAR